MASSPRLCQMMVTFTNLTRAQAIALQAMFEMWRQLGSWGCSRWVSFMADGDGNFRPQFETRFRPDPFAGLSDEQAGALKARAKVSKSDGGSIEDPVRFDFDAVGWGLREILGDARYEDLRW